MKQSSQQFLHKFHHHLCHNYLIDWPIFFLDLDSGCNYCGVQILSLDTHARVTVVILCVCQSAWYHANSHIPLQSQALYSSLLAFTAMHYVKFAENLSFGRYGVICQPR